MSQILRGILFVAYVSLFIHFIKLFITDPITEIELDYIVQGPATAKVIREIKYGNKKHRYQYQYTIVDLAFKRPVRLPTDLIYILKWTKAMTHYSEADFVNGQVPFLDKNCKFNNCYITNNKKLLTDLRYFDVILFDVENDWDYYPHIRSVHQKYIFTASEPASQYPLCYSGYNSYYNWSWTYKLDSTIPQPFFNVLFTNSTIAGPKIDMVWVKDNQTVSDDVKSKLANKKKMAAWFVSHCKTKSKREEHVENISAYLAMYNYTIDVFGWCGKYTCPQDDLNSCFDILQSDYYFYLAFENAINEDYITEKVLHALNYYTVPIVFGGANYSRFLPPGSYIDARSMSPAALVSLMIEVTQPQRYEEYFKWHNNYYFEANSLGSNLCRLCELLNRPVESTELTNFTQWWNEEDGCMKGENGEFLKKGGS